MRHFWLDLLPEFLVRNLHLSEKDATHKIQKKDKQRASYYNYYSCKKWGDSRSYDLTLNTSKITPEQCVDIILAYREKMQENKKNK